MKIKRSLSFLVFMYYFKEFFVLQVLRNAHIEVDSKCLKSPATPQWLQSKIVFNFQMITLGKLS